MLEAENVVLRYARPDGGQQIVLDHVNLTIEQGERWAVIGPSGCGKSSLLHLLAGLAQPNSGEVVYQGQQLKKPHPEISVILQEYGLFPWKTVAQNVALPLLLQKRQKKEIKERTNDLLQMLQLGEHAKKYPAQLSGGQRQRMGRR